MKWKCFKLFINQHELIKRNPSKRIYFTILSITTFTCRSCQSDSKKNVKKHSSIPDKNQLVWLSHLRNTSVLLLFLISKNYRFHWKSPLFLPPWKSEQLNLANYLRLKQISFAFSDFPFQASSDASFIVCLAKGNKVFHHQPSRP